MGKGRPETLKALLCSAEEEERLLGLREIRRGGPQEEVLQWLLPALGDESWRVRKEAVETFFSLPQADHLAGEVVEFLHADGNAGLRNTAAEILVRLGRHAVRRLIAELACNDRDVRKFALDVLGEIGDRTAVPAILDSLTDPDINVRAAAAESLGKLKALEAAAPLCSALAVEDDLLLRFTFLEALGRIGAPLPIVRLLACADEALLRPPLYQCLGRIGGPEGLPLLLQGLQDTARATRMAAVLAIARIGERFPARIAADLRPLDTSGLARTAEDLLESADAATKLSAIRIIGWLGEGRLAPRLLELLAEEEFQGVAAEALVAMGTAALCALGRLWPGADSRQRSYIAYFIGQAGCSEGQDLLLEGLASTDTALQMSCCRSLGRLGNPEILQALSRSLAEADAEVREEAAAAMARIGIHHPKPVLQIAANFLGADNPELRTQAVLILSRLRDAQVGSFLGAALKDESPLVRQAAVRAFIDRGGEESLPALTLTLIDEDVGVRRLSAEALGASGSEAALCPLGLAMTDEDIWVRAVAVRSLGMIGGPRATELIQGAISDPVGIVTIAALETLTGLDAAAAYPVLHQALRHADAEVITAALEQLLKIGRSEWIGSCGKELLNHLSWEVRIASARGMMQLQGEYCALWLEERLLAEGESLVRSSLQELLKEFYVGRG